MSTPKTPAKKAAVKKVAAKKVAPKKSAKKSTEELPANHPMDWQTNR
jgi:topoisomerase IA-like protein